MAVLLLPASLAAQAVTGKVVDSVTGQPLVRATVYFRGAAGEFVSGTDGRFRISIAPAADSAVIRRIGYVPAVVAVPRSTGPVDLGTIVLRPMATRLDRIAIETEDLRRYPQLEEFYGRRRLGGGGFFLGPDDIIASRARKTSSLLERTVKGRTECNDVYGFVDRPEATPLPSDCTAKNSRMQGTSQMAVEHCEQDMWVDGVRSGQRIDDIPVGTVVAIEAYSGPATTPARFGAGHCGVVAVWTSMGQGGSE